MDPTKAHVSGGIKTGWDSLNQAGEKHHLYKKLNSWKLEKYSDKITSLVIVMGSPIENLEIEHFENLKLSFIR